MQSLKNKIVFITGASSGIGAACAEQFAKLSNFVDKNDLLVLEKLKEKNKILEKLEENQMIHLESENLSHF